MSLNKGLVGHWRLDKESFNPGTKRFTDQTPYENHGTGNGTQLGSTTPGFQADRMGQLIRATPFNGSNDYIDCGNDNSLNFTTEDFTIAFWMNVTSLANDPILFYKGDYRVKGYFIQCVDSRPKLTTSQAGANQNSKSDVILNTGQWYHIATTRTGASGKIYQDGSEVSSYQQQEAHIDPVTSNSAVLIGDYSAVSYEFSGKLGDMRVYNRLLSAQEITLLYESYRV